MAYTVTEQKLIVMSGPAEGRARLTGITTGTGTSFVIQPGHNDVNITSSFTNPTGSVGLRTIDSWGVSDATAAAATKVVKTFDTTNKADILTVTITANDTANWWVEGDYNGS